MEAASTNGSSKPGGPSEPEGPALAAAAVPETEMRHGSPFAAGTGTTARRERRIDTDAGAAAEVARGGVWAAWLVLPFAAATTWPFPLGGVMIAGLGVALSLLGLTSPRPRWAIASLGGHAVLLVLSLMQLL